MCVGVPVVALQTGPFSVVQRGQWVHTGHTYPALVLELQQKLYSHLLLINGRVRPRDSLSVREKNFLSGNETILHELP